MKRKGFTLVELLAVIIILAIIALIVFPMVLRSIEKSKINTYRNNVQTLVDMAKQYVTKNMDDSDFPEGGINVQDLDLKNSNIISGTISKNEEGKIIATNVYNGTYCASGTKQNLIIKDVESIKDCKSIDATAPELKIRVVKTTSNSIQVNAYGYDAQTNIKGYSFKIGDTNAVYIKTKKKVATYIFTGLLPDHSYDIEVSVENKNADEIGYQNNVEAYRKTDTISTRTTSMNVPQFKVTGNSYANSKEVIITYPEINGVNSYKVIYDDGEIEEETNLGQRVKLGITKNGRIEAITAVNGENLENSLNIIGIDSKGPYVELIISDSWETEKVVELIGIDVGSGLANKSYSFNNGKNWQALNRKVFKASQKLNTGVRDKLGNVTRGFRICKKKVSGRGTDCLDPKDLNGDGICDLNCDCDGDGYSESNMDWDNDNICDWNCSKKPTGTPIYLDKKACATCEYNCVEVPSIPIPNIDTVAPTCKLKATGISGNTVSDVKWFRSDITTAFDSVRDTALDAFGNVVRGSGVKTKSIDITSITKDGKYTVTGTVIDGAGNKGTCTLIVGKDTKAPTCSISATGTLGNNNWYRSNVTLGWATSKDELSGVSTKQLNRTTIILDGQYGITGTIVDNAGNTGSCSASVKRDTTPPTCSLKVTSGTLGSNSWYRSDVAIGFNEITENVSRVQSQSIDKTNVTTDGNHNVVGTVIDKAGNTGTCNLNVKRDTNPPKVTQSTSGGCGSQVIKTTCSDILSLVKSRTSDQRITSSQTVKSTCEDYAGNVASASTYFNVSSCYVSSTGGSSGGKSGGSSGGSSGSGSNGWGFNTSTGKYVQGTYTKNANGTTTFTPTSGGKTSSTCPSCGSNTAWVNNNTKSVNYGSPFAGTKSYTYTNNDGSKNSQTTTTIHRLNGSTTTTTTTTKTAANGKTTTLKATTTTPPRTTSNPKTAVTKKADSNKSSSSKSSSSKSSSSKSSSSKSSSSKSSSSKKKK